MGTDLALTLRSDPVEKVSRKRASIPMITTETLWPSPIDLLCVIQL